MPRRHRHPGLHRLRRSIPRLYAPLSTLRRHPRGYLRMTRGRCGSLLLHRNGLAPSTSCRPSRRTRGSIDTPCNCCVRFVAIVTVAHATLTTERPATAFSGRSFTGWTAPAILAPSVMLSRAISAYSTPSAPLAGTAQLHRTATYMCCLRCAGAPREWFRAFVCRSFPACHPLRPRGAARCIHPVPSRCTFAFAGELSARHSQCWRFRGLRVHHCYDLLSCSPPLQETFTSGLSTVRSASPLPDMTTVATGQFPPTGLTPAGPTTSVAAQLPAPHSITSSARASSVGGMVMPIALA